MTSQLLKSGVVYTVVVEESYPPKLAFAYLEEIQAEFYAAHGAKVAELKRLYAFIRFGTGG